MIPYLLLGFVFGWFLGFWGGVKWEIDRQRHEGNR